MRLLNAVPALFMITAALAVIVGTAGLAVWDGYTPGARFFPIFLGTAGMILAALLLWQQRKGMDSGTLDLPDRPAAVRVGMTVAGLVVLAAGSPLVGLLPMLAVFCAFVLMVVLRQRLVPSLITTVAIAVGIDLTFVRWLAVPLPAPFGL